MSNEAALLRHRVNTTQLIVLAVVVGLYFAGYLLLCDCESYMPQKYHHDDPEPTMVHRREYPFRPIRDLYYPMGWLEQKFRKETVILILKGDQSENHFYFVR